MQTHSTIAIVAMLLAGLAAPLAAQGSDLLPTIKARGQLRCGVSEDIPGLSQRDSTGRWTGLDADFCRAVAAAVLGDADAVEFVPLIASARFPALEARRVDLLARNTTWTLTRETVLGVQFPAVRLYDGQGFLVPLSKGIESPRQLDGPSGLPQGHLPGWWNW